MRAEANAVTVTQSNALIQAAYTLTLNEKRLILIASAILDPRKPPKLDHSVRITASEFGESFGITSQGHIYDVIEDAADRLFGRTIRGIEKTPSGRYQKSVRWISSREYLHGEGAVMLRFTPEVLQYMTLLHQQFTTFQLRNVGALSSFYAIRVYELCAQFKKTGERYISLEDFREMLDLGEKYASVKDLRRWVMDPSVKEINETTDLRIQMTPKRAGRKVLGFAFTIEVDDQQRLPL